MTTDAVHNGEVFTDDPSRHRYDRCRPTRHFFGERNLLWTILQPSNFDV